MKRVFYRSLCAVLCVSMFSATIPVRAIAEEERQQENTLEQVDTGAAGNSGDSITGDIDTSEIGNESIKNDSDLANPISHQAEPQVSLTSDMSPDSEQVTKAAVSGYQHSDSATSGSVTLTVEWNDPELGQPTTFHVSATGGSGSYLFRMDAPSYSNPNEYVYESVADPSRGEWTKYTDACVSHDFTFTTTATGSYNFRFYLMDKASGVYYLRTNTYIQVADDAYPSVASIVNKAMSQAKQNTNGSEYEIALYLHDWLLGQLEYDNSLKWSSAESALTRGMGTCQAYESAYSKLLTAAGITNSETRDTYDGHTWNAVKLDGKWYQVDCTWDDTSDNFYGDLDQRHLYFCITDELMAIAHKGHAKIYTADGYATRSTSLKDNYFVHNGKADEWTAKYIDRIQQHLNAKEDKFFIDAYNGILPPSISGIQNGIIAYAMNKREWNSNDTKVGLTVTSKVTVQSISQWTAKFDCVANYSIEHKKGWSKLADGSICFYGDGGLVHGEQKIEGKWYFFDYKRGSIAIGFTTLPDGRYVYYDPTSGMAHGEKLIEGNWYFFDLGNGNMKRGFCTLPYGKFVYYKNDGSMAKGEQLIAGKWYFFDLKTGQMATGFTTLPYGKKVYYDERGIMAKGERKICGFWHYFKPTTGEISTGFVNLPDGRTVYYDNSGHMMYGKCTIDGKEYMFDNMTGALTAAAKEP